MSTAKDVVTTLASQGYFTLQVPQYSLDLSSGFSDSGVETVDEDHLIPTSGHPSKIAAGKEVGYAFTYLSRKGFNYYFNDLKAAFTPSRGTWQEWVDEANEWLDKCEAKSQKELVKMQALNAVDPKPYRIKKAAELATYLKRM